MYMCNNRASKHMKPTITKLKILINKCKISVVDFNTFISIPGRKVERKSASI